VDRFLRRSGSRVSILNACRREVPTGHSASVKSLYPLGQPKKALGHEPQIDLCVANQATPRLASFRNRSTSSLLDKGATEMEPCKIRSTPNASSHAQGLEGKEPPSPSGRRRKMSLTSPLIDQAIALIDAGLCMGGCERGYFLLSRDLYCHQIQIPIMSTATPIAFHNPGMIRKTILLSDHCCNQAACAFLSPFSGSIYISMQLYSR